MTDVATMTPKIFGVPAGAPAWDGPPVTPTIHTVAAEAELQLLGAALYAPELCDTAFERLTPDHFYDPVHGRIWGVVANLRASGSSLDLHVIAHRLGEDPGFAELGGIGLLATAIEKAYPRAAPELTNVLCDMHLRRSLAALAKDIGVRALDTADATGEAILGDMEAQASELSKATSIESAWVRAGDMVAGAIETALARKGLIRFPVGIKAVDQKLGGLNPGETTTIAAWTGMGKTIAGMQIAKANGSQRKGVAYFSLEMTAVPMAMRLACDIAFQRNAVAYSGESTNIAISKAIQGDLTNSQVERLWEAQRLAENWPIFFDTRPNLSVRQIEAATIRLHRQWAKQRIEPGPVIIDHIGKVRPTQERRGNVTAETRDIANDLDAMAKRLGVPVVVLSQLNRTVEQNNGKDKRPTLSSIKDSGALAENSRQIILLYRPEAYFLEPMEHEDTMAKAERLAGLEKVKGHFYWIIAKNSNGPPGQVLSFVDTQDDRIEIEVVGWGRDLESWSIDYEVIPGAFRDPHTQHLLDEYLKRRFRKADGRAFSIAAACHDSGGHHTEAVYRFSIDRLARQIWAIKGASDRPGQRSPIWPAKRPTAKNKEKFRPYIIGTQAAKDLVSSHLQVETPGPGYMHYPHDRDIGWFHQLTAERVGVKVIGGRKIRFWEPIPGRANEGLDCRVYAYAALAGWMAKGGKLNALASQIASLPPPEPAPEDDSAAPPAPALPERLRRPAPKRRVVTSSYMNTR
jgi:replicative DNA helicase